MNLEGAIVSISRRRRAYRGLARRASVASLAVTGPGDAGGDVGRAAAGPSAGRPGTGRSWRNALAPAATPATRRRRVHRPRAGSTFSNTISEAFRQATRSTPAGRRARTPRMLEIDRAAFDDFWEIDDDALAPSRSGHADRPSPHRAERRRRRVRAVRAAGTDGYVQRSRSIPSAQGRGLGRCAPRSTGCMATSDRGTFRAFVNTQSDNDPHAVGPGWRRSRQRRDLGRSP